MIELLRLEQAPIGTYLIFGDPWENSVWIKESPHHWTTLGKWNPETFSNLQLSEVKTDKTPWCLS